MTLTMPSASISAAPSDSARRLDYAAPVLVVGPRLDATGGMSTVVRHQLSLDHGHRFAATHFATTESTGVTEWLPSRVARHVARVIALFQTVRRQRVAIVHLHTCSGFSFFRTLVDLIAARLAGSRTVLHIHGAAFDEFHRSSGRLGRAVIRRGLAAADAVVALSRGWANSLQSMSPRANIVVIENAVPSPEVVPSGATPTPALACSDDDRYTGGAPRPQHSPWPRERGHATPSANRQLLNGGAATDPSASGAMREPPLSPCAMPTSRSVPGAMPTLAWACDAATDRVTDGVCRFLLLARMDDWKGIDEAIDAARMLRLKGVPFALTLAGPEGSAGDASQLCRRITNAGVDECVRYIGPVHGDVRLRCFAEHDALLQPSRHEGMPMSMLEAMSYGMPVVATRVGAVPEMIDDGVHGLLSPPRDAAALAKTMQQMALHHDSRREMGRAALQLARTRFSLARFANDLEELYGSILPRNPPWSCRPPSSTPRRRISTAVTNSGVHNGAVVYLYDGHKVPETQNGSNRA